MRQPVQTIVRSVSTLCVLVLAWSCATQKPTRSKNEKPQQRRAQPAAPANTPQPEAPISKPLPPTPPVASSLTGARLMGQDGQVNAHLLDFLKLFNIAHDGTAASVNKAMQANFLRQPGLERRDLVERKADKRVKAQALALLNKMGLTQEIPHRKVATDYFLLFGAMIGSVERKFADFVQQYSQGTLQCKNVVLLGGVRKLRLHEIRAIEEELGSKGLTSFLQKAGKNHKSLLTEHDLLRLMWAKHATASMKATFEEGKNLFFVNDTNAKEGTNHRPTTKTVLEAWFATYNPAPGSCHANVEQPHGVRMEKVLRLMLEQKNRELSAASKRFSITWNSPEASKRLALSVYKDELARAFYMDLALQNLTAGQ